MKLTTIVFKLIVAMVLLSMTQYHAFAQEQRYPVKPVRIIVPLSPGGATDLNARIVANELSKQLRQQFIVENRPGAGGTIGTGLAARAEADGYNLLGVSTTNMVISLQVYRKRVNYNTLRDFVPIAMTTRAPNVLVVTPSLPVKSVKELVHLAKKRPGELFYSSSGNGTNVHLSLEMFKVATGINTVHVPHKGGDQSVISIVTGETQYGIQVIARVYSLVKAGKLRALAVTTNKRAPLLPNVPTVMESGVPGTKDYDVWLWGGFVAPTGTPDFIIQILTQNIKKLLENPSVRKRITGDGSEVWYLGPSDFAAFAKSEYEIWGKAVRDSGAQVD